MLGFGLMLYASVLRPFEGAYQFIAGAMRTNRINSCSADLAYFVSREIKHSNNSFTGAQ